MNAGEATLREGREGDSLDLLDRLAESVARRPNGVAVEADDATLTYAELDRLSNQLAHRLRTLGVERESRVGISLSRGAGELLALLATSKAGGAYVPLDPGHPIDRLRLILEDAAPQVLLVHRGSPLAEGARGHVVFIDELATLAAGFPDTPLDEAPDPAQLAYILFTSGSTGRPKGVEITRGAFANFLRSMAHTPGMSADDRLLAITTTSFDIAGLELFLPLWVGGTVVIADKATVRDPRLLRRRLEHGRISILQATPAAWRLLLEAGWTGDRKLRMLCGGEALSPTLADRLLAVGGELWNMYGPTETTVWSTLERIEPGYERITIGRPIDETQVRLLDEAMKPVAVGGEGEIWIGGRGLARGYRGRPDLTRERFVQDPQGPPGELLYRTGDLGRQTPDGRFECLGRIDHQVKIRGFRIELGEIEAVLRGVSGVADALVVADQRDDGDPRLIAYTVGGASRAALVEAAQRHLPAYMVPASYIALEAFPMNTNGKIDRLRLPKAEAQAPRAAVGERPRNDLETRIAHVWCEILGVSQVPVDQSFFTLGGSSILAIQAVSRLEEELGAPVPLQLFFETPTVTAIAARLGESVSLDAPIVVRLQAGRPEARPLFCVFGVTLYRDLALALGADRPIIGTHVPMRYVPGRDERPKLHEVARRYVELIRSHQERGPYDLLGLCFGGIVAYEAARQLEAEGERVGNVVIIDALLPTAVHVDTAKRLRSSVRRALSRPGDAKRLLRKGGNALAARFRGFVRSQSPWLATGGAAIDLPIDGPEVEAEVMEFANRSTRLSARILVVRATEEPTPDWMTAEADHGWGGRARSVTVRDVDADHLGVLREPHVRDLAHFVADASEKN